MLSVIPAIAQISSAERSFQRCGNTPVSTARVPLPGPGESYSDVILRLLEVRYLKQPILI
jgi:hypothetical protein